MKNALFALIGIVLLNTVVPAFAGPDWTLIENGRKAKAAQNASTLKMMKECEAIINKSK